MTGRKEQNERLPEGKRQLDDKKGAAQQRDRITYDKPHRELRDGKVNYLPSDVESFSALTEDAMKRSQQPNQENVKTKKNVPDTKRSAATYSKRNQQEGSRPRRELKPPDVESFPLFEQNVRASQQTKPVFVKPEERIPDLNTFPLYPPENINMIHDNCSFRPN